jgi:hypothetical protein
MEVTVSKVFLWAMVLFFAPTLSVWAESDSDGISDNAPAATFLAACDRGDSACKGVISSAAFYDIQIWAG